MTAQQMMLLGGAGDPYYSSVAFLLHMDGTNGGTTFTDNGPNAYTFTASGNAQTLSAQYKYPPTAMGPSSGKVPRLTSGTKVGIALNQQFTLEGWFYANAFTANFNLFETSTIDATLGQFYARSSAGPSLAIADSTTVLYQGATIISAGGWRSFAITRDGSNVIRSFIDGVLDVTTATDGRAFTATAGSTIIGSDGVSETDGYIDELRLTLGVCRYTATYTPATSPFPNSA